MKQKLPPTVEIDPPGTVDASVVWLHGLGADGHDFEPIVPQLRLPATPGVRFVFPHAPQRSVTINDGMVMRAWYDIAGPDLGRDVDTNGIEKSARQALGLVERERERGVPGERIVLAGFSQGGVVALHAGLRYAGPLAGILALSCYLPTVTPKSGDALRADRKLPIFMGHGVYDPVIPMAASQLASSTLGGLGYAVQWHDYPMEHSVCAPELDDMRRWFLQVLADDA